MKKKYELTDDTIQHNGITLYRIRALINMPKYGIKVGDLGGYIQSENNLSHKGNCWVYDKAIICNNARVYSDAIVCDNARVYDNAKVYGNALVYSDAKVCDNARVYGYAWVYGSAWVYGYAKVYGDAIISGEAMVFDKAMVFDNARVFRNARISGNARVFGNAQVFGCARIYDDAKAYHNAQVFGDSKLSGYIGISFSTQVKDIELDGLNSFDDFIKLYPLKIRNNKAILYKAVHKIDDKYMSDYDNNFEYKIGQIYEHKCNSDIREDCSYGLHVATKEWTIDYSKDWENLAILEVEVPIDKLIIPLTSIGELRTSELRVIREIPKKEYE